MRITLPHAPGVMGSPVFRDNRKPLSLVQRPGTSARIASTGRCGRLEDSHDATTLPRPCKCKTKPYFHIRLRKAAAREIPSTTDESTGEKMSRNLAEKRASPGRPQGNFHLDSSSRVRLTAACLRNPPPYFKSAPLQGAPFMEQLVSHIAALITLRLRLGDAGRLQLSISASASAYEFL